MGRARRIEVLSSVFTVALLVLGGCGRTTDDCQTCADPPVAGTGGASTSHGGGVTTGGGGSPGTGGRAMTDCDVGAVSVPLVRYPLVDLQQTMDAVVGTGPGFTGEGYERLGQGPARFAALQFVEQLMVMASERALSAPVDAESIQVCEDDVQDRGSCIDNWLRERGQRLYRRPLTDAQIAGYLAQFNARSRDSSGVDAARSVLLSMMLSPYFVFRIELGENGVSALNLPPTGDAPIGLPAPMLPPGTLLDSFEIAARLSQFVTRSAPDPELLANAASGQLLATDAILAQYERLASTEAGSNGRALQHLEWLAIDDLGGTEVASDEELSQLMRLQTSAFILDVLQNRNGSLLEMLSSSRIPLNRRLAEHYGIDSAVGDGLELVDLDPTLFGGILSQGATLSRYGLLTQRGAHLVMDRLQCTPIPPPPGILFSELPYMGSTPRERISSVTETEPQCAGCHGMFNSAGFALEAFDSQGRLTGFDTTGGLLISPDQLVVVDGPAGLGRAIAATNGRLCVAQRYLEYALDRSLNAQDEPLLRCLSAALQGADVDLNQLARLVVTSGALRRMTRPALAVVATSSATDPVEHAIEETHQLLAAFPDPDEQQRLDQYAVALQEWQATLPAQ